MKMHFVTTGDKFPLSYYIGVASAEKCGEVKLWYLQKPNSPYFDKLTVEKEKVMVPDFPALQNRDKHFNLVSLFDYLIWKIIAREGGSVMGLDSITIAPFQNLIKDKEILVGRDAETVNDSYCMHGATVIKGSQIAQKIHEDSAKALQREEISGRHRAFRDGKLRFGGAGIIPFLNNVYKNMDKVAVADFGVLGGYVHDGSPFYLYEDSQLLTPETKTIPFYATWQDKKFNQIDEEFLKENNLLSRLVKKMKI